MAACRVLLDCRVYDVESFVYRTEVHFLSMKVKIIQKEIQAVIRFIELQKIEKTGPSYVHKIDGPN